MSLKLREAAGLASGEANQVIRALSATIMTPGILLVIASGDTHALQKSLPAATGAIARAIQVGDENKSALLAGLV